MAKVYKYSLKSEAAMYYKEAVLKKFKNFTEKNICKSLFLDKVAGLHTETFFLKKKAPVHVFSCKPCQIF